MFADIAFLAMNDLVLLRDNHLTVKIIAGGILIAICLIIANALSPEDGRE